MALRRSALQRFMVLVGGLALGLIALGTQAQVNATFTSKVFNPTAVAPGVSSTLTVTLTNNTAAQLNGVTFTDTFPAGFQPDGNLNFVSGCAVGSSISSIVGPPGVFSGNVNINASTACIVSVGVFSNSPGVFNNTTANISGWNGNALAFAPSALVVGLQSPIPTLSDFALLALAMGIALLAYRARFRRAKSKGVGPA